MDAILNRNLLSQPPWPREGEETGGLFGQVLDAGLRQETPELESALRQLVHSYRHAAAGRLCLGIIHRMNTPLQVLSFLLELLEDQHREELIHLHTLPAPLAEPLETLRKERCRRLSQCRRELDDLGTLSRRLLQQGAHEEDQQRRYQDLNHICQEQLELYEAHPFFRHRLAKHFSFCEKLPPLLGHYLDFSQSFRNLLDNALEAMEGADQPVLTVATAMEEGRRIVRIGDNGEGIPPDLLPRLGTPFVTTRSTPERPRAGLGLFLSRRLLAPYRGYLTVASLPGRTWVAMVLP